MADCSACSDLARALAILKNSNDKDFLDIKHKKMIHNMFDRVQTAGCNFCLIQC